MPKIQKLVKDPCETDVHLELLPVVQGCEVLKKNSSSFSCSEWLWPDIWEKEEKSGEP